MSAGDQRFVARTLTTMASLARPSRERLLQAIGAGVVLGTRQQRLGAEPRHAAGMRSSSVATTTRLAALLRAWFQTRWIIGWPAISRNGLPGRRVEA